jgi:hypothetical protein
MIRSSRLIPLLLAVLAATAAVAVYAQAQEPPEVIVGLHRLAPGKQLDFLKWLAENDAIAREAGVAPSQVYAHSNGDSWDYMVISAIPTAEQQSKIDDLTKKRGRKSGFAASLEFRTFVASHTDTHAYGPMSAADLVAAAGK